MIAAIHDPANGVHAYACEGAAQHAMIWNESQLTVRVSRPARDEVWVVAGAGILARLIADSDGDFGDSILDLVTDVLSGHAIEIIVREDDTPALVPAGWRITSGDGERAAGGFSCEDGIGVMPVLGHFAHLDRYPR